MKHRVPFLSLLLALALLAGCASVPSAPTEGPSAATAEGSVPTEDAAPTEAATIQTTEVPTDAPTEAPVLSRSQLLLQEMTLREKVGQLFIVRPDALELFRDPAEIDDSLSREGVTSVTGPMLTGLQQYPVGGFILFDRNIVSPEQVKGLNRQLREACTIPPFLAVDEEGGIVARLANNIAFDVPSFSSARDVCARGSVTGVQDMGFAIGGYLSDYGFNMDMAPDADVFTNPQNRVIGSRAFSSDPWEAANCARAMADGLRLQGIVPVFKHFPGHGNTSEDSHTQLAVSHRTQEELDDCEWIPFYQAEDSECIMVGHIALPEVTEDMTPASLSPMLLRDILRERLGFRGIIMTDSLSMGAILNGYDPNTAPLMALKAGCDILLMPYNLPEAFEVIVAAVESGEFPEEQLDEAVLRILDFKEDYHLF